MYRDQDPVFHSDADPDPGFFLTLIGSVSFVSLMRIRLHKMMRTSFSITQTQYLTLPTLYLL
jgi:hypothetical protein